ncbi:MAG: protein phosphatase 2C domain-containing protein [Myxococcales bacterium]|nr:protein phosphatase 2C domain-containing protein [Myxococcales bacterium]
MRFGEHELVLSNGQDIGQRSRQEDYFGFWTDSDDAPTCALVVVADGMGGLEGGDAASVLAVDAFVASMRDSDPADPVSERFQRAASIANTGVHEVARASGASVGSTLVALYLTHDDYQWISIGDSPLYLVREGQLRRLNRDHNLAERLADQLARGEITEQEAAAREEEHQYLTSNLGLEVIPEMDVAAPEPLRPGDRFVLASDGLSDTLSLERIEGLVAGDPEDTAERLVRAALEQARDNQDNITVASVAIDSPAPIGDTAPDGGGGGARLWPLSLLLLALVTVLLFVTDLFGPSGGQPASEAAAPASPEPPVAAAGPDDDAGALQLDAGVREGER